MDIVNWIVANIGVILSIVAGTHMTAVAIVNLTPTPRDDEIVGQVYRVVEYLAGVFTRTAKELPGERDNADV